jgi:DNA-binding NarL/FixJ family response regulator
VEKQSITKNLQLEPNKSRINILIADDHLLVSAGLKQLIGQDDSYEVVGMAKNGREAITLLSKFQVDLLITDLNMPDMDGFQLMENTIIQKAKSAGAHGFFQKGHDPEELLGIIGQVLAGKKVFPDDEQERFTNKKIFEDTFDSYNKLSQREMEIFHYLAKSMTNREISEILHISEFTVQTHRRNLKKKLGARNSSDFVQIALQNNLL